MEALTSQETFAETDVGLRDYLHLILRRRWWLLSTFTVVVISVLLYVLTATKVFEARTRLMVDTGQSRRILPGDPLGGLMGMTRTRDLETQIEIVYSDAVRDKAALTMGDMVNGSNGAEEGNGEGAQEGSAESAEMHFDPRTADLWNSGHRPRLMAEGVKTTDVITIKARSPSAVLAAKYANAIANAYVKVALERNNTAATQGVDFVREQLDKAEKDLKKAETALAEFQRDTGITAVNEAARRLMDQFYLETKEAGDARTRIAAGRAEVAALRGKLNQDRPMVKASETLILNPLIESLRGQLSTLEADRASLSGEFAPTSQRLRELDGQIQAIRDQMAQEAERIVSAESLVNPVDAELLRLLMIAEIRLIADAERSAAVSRRLGDTQVQVNRLPEDQQKLGMLQRKVSLEDRAYMELETKLRELRIAQASEIAGATIIRKATEPKSPIRPQRRRTMLMGIVLGLMLALAVAVLVNHLDDTFGTIQEIERQLGTSVLTVVYRVGPDEDPLLPSPLGRSSFAEAFRMLRSALKYSAVKHPIHTLVLTSPGVGEGKSTVSTNTAIACAESDQRTIIVDADLRRATLHKILGLHNNTGLTNCLVNGVNPAEALQDTNYPNLRLLSSGPLPPNPGELLESEAMRTLIDQLKDEADLVIFDTPPGMLLADAQVLSRVCDAVMLVMEMDSTKRPMLTRLVELFRREDIIIPGVIVNKARRAPGSYYYYYSYYYYSHYYSDGEDEDEQDANNDTQEA